MSSKHVSFAVVIGLLALVVSLTTSVRAQANKELLDPNIAAEKDLLALPHMTPAIVKGMLEKRPFKSITELNAFLLGQGLTAPQAADFYGKAFVKVDLNTATREQILLIPGAGARMAREFAEYRPWKAKEQFDKEIGKYVGPEETARLWKYVVIR